MFDEICKEIIGQMDFSLLRDHLILCPRISAVSRFFVFLCFVLFNAFSEICKETIGQVDFSLLQDRPILGARICVSGRRNVFSSLCHEVAKDYFLARNCVCDTYVGVQRTYT